MKSESNNIKRNTLRRIAALAMLLMAFTVSAQAQYGYDDGCWVSLDGKHSLEFYANSATCTSSGYITYYCPLCGHKIMGENTPPLGHDWGDPFGDDVAPTCTTAGGKNHTCKRCGATELDNSVAALGHDWGEWTDVAAATCTVAAQHSHTCQRDGCGVSETCSYGDPLGHNWSDNWITVAPTCTEQGYTGHPCTRCDAVDKHIIVAALGHSWSADYRCIRCDFDCPAISYVKADGTEGSHQAIPITGGEDDDVVMGFGSGDMWYYLSGNVTLKSLCLTDRTVNIILTARCNITTSDGIRVTKGSLNIYSQNRNCLLYSSINAYENVNLYGGRFIMEKLRASRDITLGWTNINDMIYTDIFTTGGTITIAKGKAMMNIDNKSEIFYGDGTPIRADAITNKMLVPKTNVLCYVDGDGVTKLLKDGDYTVLTNSTDLSAYNSSSDAAERWFVVKDANVNLEKLDICGTTHLVLLDDASLTFSCANDYPIYHAGTFNIYGGLKGNGRLTVSSGDYHTAIRVIPFRGSETIPGYLNIYGGQVSATSASGTGIQASSGATLSWTRPNNSIYANSYAGSAPNLAKAFTDGDDIYYGTLTADDLTAIAGKTLTPYVIIAGDVNGNGEVDIDDAVSILRHLVNKPNEKFIEAAAKLNDNDEIDIDDAVEILKFLVGKIDALSRARATDTDRDKAPDPDPTESDPD